MGRDENEVGEEEDRERLRVVEKLFATSLAVSSRYVYQTIHSRDRKHTFNIYI